MTHRWVPNMLLPLWVRVDLRVMAVKGYSTFSRALESEPHYQMLFSVIPRESLLVLVLLLCKDTVNIFSALLKGNEFSKLSFYDSQRPKEEIDSLF